MKKITLLTLILTVMFVLQYGAAGTSAATNNTVLLDPRDGLYMTRIINLTGEQLSIAITNDTSSSTFTNPFSKLYTPQTPVTPNPIKLDTLLQHNPQKSYAIPAGKAYWEGMINLTPLIPASNENNSYATYSGHFSQGQRLTFTTVNNASSILNNASIQFGYVYSSTQTILWGKVFDFAASTIKNAAEIASACEDGDVQGALSAGSKEIKSIIGAFQTNPVTASLNSATKLTQQPTTSQTSEFTNQVTKNYLQAQAFFAASGGGSCITDASTNNQIYTLASAQQVVVTLTASDNSVRYFTAPAYYIYIKNVEAPVAGDINECTIAIIDGWVYNLAVGMYNSTQTNPSILANLQNLTPLQLMYYAGSPVAPLPGISAVSTQPAVNVNAAPGPVTIISATISHIGG
ncbi:MAG: hypothetical protein P4N41_14490 [Negativicutes bacterium]|nr:hypothetical protein [Negativicutes bacterium]